MSISLIEIGIQLIRTIAPIIIIVGIVSNSLNIAVLTRRTLYNHSCSRYFLAVAINNLFYSIIVSVHNLLTSGYQTNLANYSIVSCRIIYYISSISSFISPYLIVFASIDRYCASSTNVQIRKFSCVRISTWMIFIVIVLSSLFFIHILVLFDLQPTRGFICALQANTIYSQVYIITQIILYAIIPPSFMMFFGLMTIRNTNRQRIVPVVISYYNRTEQQLARMLIFQVSVHVLLTLPSSVIYLISDLPNTISTTSTFSFVATVCQLFFNCSYISSFFLYLLSGRIYREELIRLIQKIFRIRRVNQVEPSVNEDINIPITTTAYPPLT